MSNKFDNQNCKNQARQLYNKTLSIPNLSKNTTYKSGATVIYKFKILFFEEIKKFKNFEFLTPIATHTISCR